MTARRSAAWLSESAFTELVKRALDDLPENFARALDNVVVVVEDEPDAEILAEMELPQGEELLGLYHGVPLPERDGFYSELPDRVSIYRGPILRICETRREVIAEVRDTVVHELGHYFGLSDDQMPY